MPGGAAGQTQWRWHMLGKKVPPQIYKIQENITNSLFGQKKSNPNKTWKQMHFFNLYVWSANYSDFSKVCQMKFRLWLVILTEIANMSPGQKNLESCQTNVLEQSLSSPLAFPILVNIKPYQKYTKITQNAVFNFFSAKFGVLPFLQECPWWWRSWPLFCQTWMQFWNYFNGVEN